MGGDGGLGRVEERMVKGTGRGEAGREGGVYVMKVITTVLSDNQTGKPPSRQTYNS